MCFESQQEGNYEKDVGKAISWAGSCKTNIRIRKRKMTDIMGQRGSLWSLGGQPLDAS